MRFCVVGAGDERAGFDGAEAHPHSFGFQRATSHFRSHAKFSKLFSGLSNELDSATVRGGKECMATPSERPERRGDSTDPFDAPFFGISRRRFLIGTTGLFITGGVGTSLIEGVWAADPQAADRPFDRESAERFMHQAIALSRRGMEAGDGGPFGAVIVKEGQVVGEGWNRVLVAKDPTAHGEIVAIRDTCKKLASFNLTGCELYTSSQPCPMCLGAIYWARIDRVYYGNSVKDAAAIGFDDESFYEQLTRPSHMRQVPEVQVLGDEAIQVFRDYAKKPGRVTY